MTKVWYGKLGQRWYVSNRLFGGEIVVRHFRSGARAKDYAECIAEIDGCVAVLVKHD